MLVSLLNDLHEATLRSKSPAMVLDTLMMLQSFTIAHFGAEEELMKRFFYPEYETHKALHDALLSAIKDLAQRFQDDDLVLTMETMQFIRRWLAEHILLTDKKLGGFLRQVASPTVVMPKLP